MKRFFKWALGLLIALLIGIVIWGYAPDRDPAELRAKYANAASQFIQLEPGLSVHVRDEGKKDGPAILLLHGSNSSLQTWEPWVKRLGGKYRLISLDLTGHGLTGPHPKRDYRVETTVSIVDGVMTKLGVSKFAVAGNSMGGWVSWNYALTHPGKVTALALLDASGAPDAAPKALPIGFRMAQSPLLRPIVEYITPRSLVAKSLAQSVSVKAAVTPNAVDRYWELLLYPGNRRASGDQQKAFPFRAPATPTQMASLKMPTLIMWGAEDQLVPPSAAYWFAKAIPGAKEIIYPGVGHLPMEEVPDQSASDFDAFLTGTAKANK